MTQTDPACGNGPRMSRRALLAALPAAAAAGPAAADLAEDPVLPIYREWLRGETIWRNAPVDTPETDALRDRVRSLHLAMIEQGACSMEGIAALAHAMWVEDGPCSLEGSEYHAHEIQESGHAMLAAIWRAASGCEGLPPRIERDHIQP